MINKYLTINRPPLLVIFQHIFNGPTFTFPKHSLDEFSPRTRGALDLLSWLAREGFELSYLCRGFHFSGYKDETKPWHGFKIALNAQKQNEDFAAGKNVRLVLNIAD